MPIKAILFDHDGTLVDSEPAHFEIWRTVLARYNTELSERQYRDIYAGVPARANALDMIARFSIAETPERLVEQKVVETREYLSRTAFPIMPDAREVTGHFHSQGLRMAIVTGSSQAVVAATTRTHQLAPYFETVVASDDVERNKPHPDGYLLAMQRLGVQADECLAIEDTEHGLMAAADAGIPCLVVPNAMSMHHDFSRATASFGGLAEVRGWVAEKFRQS